MTQDIQGLIEKVKSYYQGGDVSSLRQAYEFADHCHKNQKRASGEPYISHPLAVAHMIADLKLDLPSITAGLLHDTVEDTSVTLEDIQKTFGEEIAYLVDGVTKLSRIELQSKSHTQAENLRKFVLAMAQDIRVLIIKLMDRMHNMETIHHLPSQNSRERIAKETLEIYAPLAQRIGMFFVQEQLQNMSFSVVNPEAYNTILSRIAEFHERDQDIVERVVKDLDGILNSDNLKASVYGREKKPYSIWRKMQNKNINFDQLSDLFGFRVIVPSTADCYQALYLIHQAKVVIPDTFKDYISTPKPNHYRSVHTTVLGPRGARLEIQIRTQHMQEVAERGVAAHWQYKQGIPARDMKNYQWLQGLLDILEHASGAEEFLEHTKLQMFQDQVFCFTPKGDVINLPMGGTVIDFAYALHSEIGNKAQAAKVNGRHVALKEVLQNGDQVEIITHSEAGPSSEWLQEAITGKAQSYIRRFLRAQKRSQFLKLGQSIYHHEFSETQKAAFDGAAKGVCKHFGVRKFEDLWVSLGEGKIRPQDLLDALTSHQNDPAPQPPPAPKPKEKPAVVIKGMMPGVAVHYAGCCHPLPGDKITGILIKGKGVTVHISDCEMLQQYKNEPRKWLNVCWGKTEGSVFQGRVIINLKNVIGAFGEITTMIGNNCGDISNFRVTRRHREFFEIMVDIRVKDALHMDQIIGFLRALPCVQTVERA